MKRIAKRFVLLLGSALALSGCSAVVGGGKGPTGDPGEAGPNGKDGQDGSNAYEEYVSKHPDYTGDEEQWMDDLVNGRIADYGYLNGFILLKMQDGNCGIFGYFGGYKDELKVPADYHGMPITSVLPNGFANCSVGKLVFSSNMERFEAESFACSKIGSIVGTENVKYIGHDAFADSAIKTIPLGDSLTYIGDNAFARSTIRSIVVPSNVTYIGKDAFDSSRLETFRMESCDPSLTMGDSTFLNTFYLREVVLPDNLRAIPLSAFMYSHLETISLPEGLITVGGGAFANSSLKELVFNSKLEDIQASAFAVTNIASIVIPGSVSNIATSAFSNCMWLDEVRIEDGVDKKIGSQAFTGCQMLSKVYIPQSVKTMESDVFTDCLTGTVFCAAPSLPEGWNSSWLGSRNFMDVVWGYSL